MSAGSALSAGGSLARRAVSVATAPARTGVGLALSLPTVTRELGPLVRNLRLVAGDLHRLAGEDGELSRLLREGGDLAAQRAGERPDAERDGDARGGRGRTRLVQ